MIDDQAADGSARAAIRIQAGNRKSEINPWIYGQFLEHIFHSVDLGLHAEMLTERTFQLERDHMAHLWQKTANGGPFSVSLESRNSLRGERCLLIRVEEDLAEGEGVCQALVPARQDEPLDGYIYLRSPFGAGPVLVGLRNSASRQVYASAVVSGLKPYWQKHSFSLLPTASDLDAEFFITASRKGQYFIGEVSLMPLRNRQGQPWRDDLLQACQALHPTMIRWPGGCYASQYDWQSGIGPPEARRAQRTCDWGDGGETDPSTFGTDEFIAFCRATGAEPLLVLNLIRGVQDALDWIEYCNGGTETPWGAKRAGNGHPEPFQVTCWSIDNEQWYWVVDEAAYLAAANEFMAAIKARHPDCRLWVVGSGQPFEALDNPLTRATAGPRIMAGLDSQADFSSYHYYYSAEYADYGALMASNLDLEELFEQEAACFRETGHTARLAFDEWNPGGIEYKSGLASALLLNSLERRSDLAAMASPAVWLRNIRLSGVIWNNALINHDHKSWFPSATYLAMQLWSGHRARYLLDSEVVCGAIPLRRLRRHGLRRVESVEPVPLLDVAASGDDSRIMVKVVNRSPADPVTCLISLPDIPLADIESADAHVLYHDDLETANSLENPGLISLTDLAVRLDDRGVHVVFPRHSAAIIEFKLRRIKE